MYNVFVSLKMPSAILSDCLIHLLLSLELSLGLSLELPTPWAPVGAKNYSRPVHCDFTSNSE